jgi:hypothetical protein
MRTILYPLQVVTGGGRARGFRVEKYLPWENLLELQAKTEVWDAIECLYRRLAAAYDHFYEVCGFLSPLMTELIGELRRSYADSYLISQAYTPAYNPISSNIAKAYADVDYSDAYTLLWNLNVTTEDR